MICEQCKEREAVVRFKQVAGGQVTTLALCSKCAADKGIDTEIGISPKTPLESFLNALGRTVDGDPTGAACPGCGAALDDFRTTGRVGCAACYVAFEGPLRDLLRRLHGSTHHAGIRPPLPAQASEPSAPRADPHELARVRRELAAAIGAEEFERAARLRDELRGLE